MGLRVSLSVLEIIDLVESRLKSYEWDFMRTIGTINDLWFRPSTLLEVLSNFKSGSELKFLQNASAELINLTRNEYRLDPYLKAGYVFYNISMELLKYKSFAVPVGVSQNTTVRSFLWGLQNSLVQDQAFTDYFKVSDNATEKHLNLQLISAGFNNLSKTNLGNNSFDTWSQLMVRGKKIYNND